MAQVDTPTWLAWVAPAGVIMGALWAGARRLLISVTRDELAAILKEQEEAREKRRSEQHLENIARFGKHDDELKKIGAAVARIEGQISGRYPRLER